MIIREKIQELVNEELKEAEKKHGKYLCSHHEKYAVMLEEYEEAMAECDIIKTYLIEYWKSVKFDNPNKCSLDLIKNAGISAIQELIQVACVCDKEVR